MSELTDLLIQAVDGNAALALVLVGLALLNGLQTRYIEKRLRGIRDRLGTVETRVRRSEDILIEGEDRRRGRHDRRADRRADGGHPPQEEDET